VSIFYVNVLEDPVVLNVDATLKRFTMSLNKENEGRKLLLLEMGDSLVKVYTQSDLYLYSNAYSNMYSDGQITATPPITTVF